MSGVDTGSNVGELERIDRRSVPCVFSETEAGRSVVLGHECNTHASERCPGFHLLVRRTIMIS